MWIRGRMVDWSDRSVVWFGISENCNQWACDNKQMVHIVFAMNRVVTVGLVTVGWRSWLGSNHEGHSCAAAVSISWRPRYESYCPLCLIRMKSKHWGERGNTNGLSTRLFSWICLPTAQSPTEYSNLVLSLDPTHHYTEKTTTVKQMAEPLKEKTLNTAWNTDYEMSHVKPVAQ